MSICLIDTSIFCNVLRVPGRDQDHVAIAKALRAKVQAKEILLLPLATMVETGNHIAHVANGNERYRAAERFQVAVIAALDGKTPWTPMTSVTPDHVRSWVADFPAHAASQTGLGDVSIIRDFDRQCALHHGHHIYVWSLDAHLQACDRPPLL